MFRGSRYYAREGDNYTVGANILLRTRQCAVYYMRAMATTGMRQSLFFCIEAWSRYSVIFCNMPYKTRQLLKFSFIIKGNVLLTFFLD